MARGAGADEQVGSVSLRPGGTPRRGWVLGLVPLLLLGLLAAAVVLLLARNAWDEGDEAGIDLRNDPSPSGEAADDPATDEDEDSGSSATAGATAPTVAGAAAPTTATAPTATSPTATAPTATAPTAPAAGGPSGAGTKSSGGSGGVGAAASAAPLTSGGTALLPLPAGGLGAYSGAPAEARSVTVESVVSDEGFWVGDSPTERVFVRLVTGGIESPVGIEAGRTVSFTGTVTPNPADVGTLGVTAEEGAGLLSKQGQHIEVPLGQIRQG